MDWSAFLGAIVGSIIGILGLLGSFLIWDHFDRRKTASQSKVSKSVLDDLLESHLEEFIVKKFDVLFPGWTIYDLTAPNNGNKSDKSKPKGVRYRTDAGEIDILCTDEDSNFVVIELKRNKAPDKVVSQVDRYIAWVEQNLAESSQSVRGVVIAKSFNNHLHYSLSRRDEIELWVYDWQLAFDRSAMQNTQTEHVSTVTE